MSLNQQPFFNPCSSRIPLHRQFLQESTEIGSSTFVPKLSTTIQRIALFSVWKHRLHETQKNESQCWVPHRRAVWTRRAVGENELLPWWRWRCRCCCSSGRVLPSPATRWLVTWPVRCPWPQRRSRQPIIRKENWYEGARPSASASPPWRRRVTSSSSLSSCTVGVCVFSWMLDTASPWTLNFSAAASWACWERSSI